MKDQPLDYDNMSHVEVRMRAEEGDEAAAEYERKAYGEIAEMLKPLSELSRLDSAIRPTVNTDVLAEIGEERARERRAAVERETRLRDAAEGLLALMKRNIDDQATQARTMRRLTIVAVTFGCVGAIGTVVSVLLALSG